MEASAEADGTTVRLQLALGNGERRSLDMAVRSELWHAGFREPSLRPFCHRTDEDAAAALPEADSRMLDALVAGLRLLDAASPAYAGWVRGIVRQVAPLALNGTVVASWSSLHYPGLISLTLFDSPIDMAETLVHEASHQRYHLLDRCFPMVELGAIENMYWSPIKRCPRPLPMLLLAFHAFGNIALLFHELWRRGVLNIDRFSYHMADLREWLPAIANTLDSSTGLTADGESFWRDLYSQVTPALHEPKEARV
jgi:HEXXH motif-containing protein